MDRLWSLWKFLCCGNEDRASDSALFASKYILCRRKVYFPLPPIGFVFDPPFFVDSSSQFITARVLSDDCIEIDDDKLQYRLDPDQIHIKSYDKKKTTHLRICCGCLVEDPEDYMFDWFRERPVIYKYVPNREGLHPYETALKKMAEFAKEKPIGILSLSSYSYDADDRPLREKRYRKMFGATTLSIPFLVLSFSECSYKPWVELVDYQSLSIKTEKMAVTEKMLTCQFLNVEAVLSNPEELENFRGFGLLIGKFDKNGFTFDRIIEEIELWKNKTPSSLECFGLFKLDIQSDPGYPEIVERLKKYSPSGEVIEVNKAPVDVEVMILDEEEETAILFVMRMGICFVRGGYKKWIRLFDYIY